MADRKKESRGGHQVSALRVLNQVYEMTGDPDLNHSKLKQSHQEALTGKLEVLNKLDSEILELLDEDELADEIEQADTFTDKIQLAIIDIDQALKGDVNPVGRSALEGESSVITTHTSPLTVLTTGSSSTESADVPKMKLPKLTLKRFNGDLANWTTFWDSFESSIHNNTGLSNIDKINYLNSFLERSAAEAISGLTLNYDEAITILKKRFGNKQLIINKHMDILLNLDAVTSLYNLRGLRHLFDLVESNVRGLRSLGVPPESYGSLLSSVLMNKLPQEFRLLVSRDIKDGEWELDSLMRVVEKEMTPERDQIPILHNPKGSIENCLQQQHCCPMITPKHVLTVISLTLQVHATT